MATFTLDGIQFTAAAASKLPGKYGNGSNANFEDAEEDGVKKFVNAVEIDWNNAVFPEEPISEQPQTINSTGDLIKAISWTTYNYAHHPKQDFQHEVLENENTKLFKIKLDDMGHVIDASEFTAQDLLNEYLEAGNQISLSENNGKIKIAVG